MRKLLLFVFLVASCAAFAQVPSPSTPRLQNERGYISDANPLQVTGGGSGGGDSVLASETIGLIDAISEIKTALETQGSNASETAITAAIGEVKEAIEGIDFNTTPIVNALNDAPSEIVTRKITLDANTNTSISSALSVPNRLYIEITTMKPEDEIWVNFGGAAVVGQTRRVSGGIGLKLVKSYQLGVIASTSLDIYITEGGKNGD